MTTLAPNHSPQLDAPTFERIRLLIRDAAGIVLSESKISLVCARLSKRLAATGHTDPRAYLDYVERHDGAGEREHLVSAMTTNVTHFFREAHHFQTLHDFALQARTEDRPLRLWSAGCSSGPEPYSAAMILAAAGYSAGNARVLATDIDRGVVARGMAATYPARDLDLIPPGHVGCVVQTGDSFHLTRTIRDMVDFKPLNLVGSWPFRTSFDVIFCRNVAIYFDPPTQDKLWSRMMRALRPGGLLFMGHSERLPPALLRQVTCCGQTTYRKGPGPESAPIR